MNDFKTVREAWISYSDRVIPEESPPVQFKECRQAFYAGAASMMALASMIAKKYGENIEQAEAELNALEMEIFEFAQKIGAEGGAGSGTIPK